MSGYRGEPRDGVPHGKGVMTWPDGSRIVGEFRDGKPRGRGVVTLPDGHRFAGEWRDGEPASGARR